MNPCPRGQLTAMGSEFCESERMKVLSRLLWVWSLASMPQYPLKQKKQAVL